jgi:hypothetical protein
MSHFAKVKNGIVDKVIVAESEFFDTFVDETPGEWIQTSYTGSIRKNYAGVGDIYDKTRDAFYEPKPYPSWTLNESTCIWEPPVAHPAADGKSYTWNEASTNWVEIE